jgi:antitoxin PrlF
MAVRPSPSLSTPVDSALDGVESSLTDRYQTTVPQPVRRALGLGKRDRIRYCFRANGEVVLQRVSPETAEEDPALAPFLALLEQDISRHPKRLQPISGDLVERLHSLVAWLVILMWISMSHFQMTTRASNCGQAR